MTQSEIFNATAWSAFTTRLNSYVRRRVDAAAADDVLGDILLRLVRHRQSLHTADNPGAWMLRVAASAIVDHYRHQSAERQALERFQTEPENLETYPANDGADETTTAERSACLIPLLQNLPQAYREALLLTDIRGLTQNEAARQLGLSASGMKSRVQRGRAQLKQALLRCCEVELDRRGAVLDYRRRLQDCDGGCGRC
jgi:RNA polymerase sigma-70 factor (ECF subfamily)